MTEKTFIHVDPIDKDPSIPDCGSTEGKCPACGAILETGFGLAGGGYGVYEYCPNEGCAGLVTKTVVEE